jgi:positive regulator of sigma E activity
MKKDKTTPTKTTNMLLAAFMLFILPIILIFTGVFLGAYAGKHIGMSVQTSQIIGGIIGFILSIIIIKLFDRSSVVNDEQEKIYWDDL